MSEQRKIIHVDMDAFFAAVEQRDNPLLRDSTAGQDKVRLLDITLSNLDIEKPLLTSRQLLLPFDDAMPVAI